MSVFCWLCMIFRLKLSDFYITLGTSWLSTYNAKIDDNNLKVVGSGEEDSEVLYYPGSREENLSLNFFDENKEVIVSRMYWVLIARKDT